MMTLASKILKEQSTKQKKIIDNSFDNSSFIQSIQKDIDDYLENLECPQYAPNVFHNQQVATKLQFDLNDGAQFLRMDSLDDNKICEVIGILAALVDYSNLKDKKKKVHERALPNLLVNICHRARLDGGERLMRRAPRHALDPRRPNFLLAKGSIIADRLEGEKKRLSLQLDSRVRASMKDAEYRNTVAFTRDKLLWCHCEAIKTQFARLIMRQLKFVMIVFFAFFFFF